MRKLKRRTISLAAGSALAVTTLGTGAAYAANAHTQAPTITSPAVTATAPVDGDNLQQGDQTTPDSGAAAPETAAAAVKASPVKATAVKSVSGRSITAKAAAAETATPETSTAEAPEGTPSEADGPGGHTDGPGNVDHQFNGNE
jgi:hypothetical protein